MLATKLQQLGDTFKALPAIDRQLMALKSICCQYTTKSASESAFLAKVIHSGITDEQGRVLTPVYYQSLVKRLFQLELTSSPRELTLHKELHHLILVWMPAEELPWVFTMGNVLYPSPFPDFIKLHNDYVQYQGHSSIHRSQLIQAMYANDSSCFLENPSNPLYGSILLGYLHEHLGAVPVNIDWLRTRQPIIQSYICIALLGSYYCEQQPTVSSKDLLVVFCQQNPQDLAHDTLDYYSALIHLSLGRIDHVFTYCAKISDTTSGLSLSLQATLACLNNQFKQASILYRKALTACRKQYDDRRYYFDTILGLFHQLCLAYADHKPAQLATHTTQFIKYAYDYELALPMGKTYRLLQAIMPIEQGDQRRAQLELEAILKNPGAISHHPLPLAIYHLLQLMVNTAYADTCGAKLRAKAIQCLEEGYILVAHLLYELLERTEGYRVEARAFLETSEIKFRFLAFIDVKEAWEYSFQALEGLLLDGVVEGVVGSTATKRLLWLIDPEKQMVDVIEQCLSKSGQWSPGKAVNLEKLKYYHQHEQFDYLSAEDKRAASCIEEEEGGWRYKNVYAFDPYRTLLALIGNKHIAHHKNRSVSIELTHGEPELHIEEKNGGYHLSLSHWLSHAGLIIEPESMNKYRLIDVSPAFVNIGQILTQQGLSIPAIAKEKVLRVIQHTKRDIAIHVGIDDMDIPEMVGDPNPCIQLLPMSGSGVSATLWVRPLEHHGTYCKPGEGKESLMTLLTENGRETRARILRDFKREKSNQAHVLQQCVHFARHEAEGGEYLIETPEDTLEVLSELQQYAEKHPLTIEWPQGQTFKIKQRVATQGLSLNIASVNNWFEYHGEITLHDGEVLSMQALLQGLATQSYGRFVRLGNGDFLELTSQLKKQLSLLAALSDDNKINPLGAQILSDIVAEAELTSFDAGWEAHVKKMKTMKAHHPKVPSTLQATLRDYQIEGFQYLSRLTHWGMGACLADDMGLGKTIQTIAFMLERAKHGATLVVAPTSVGFNWIEELNKFAPTLKVHDLRTDDRAAVVDKAGKFDVVICSYGLLQYNDELLAEKQWETIVLDEAQAIKNANTQRWKTVMKLKGKRRIALSGTPIENHLGELWSIFSFINPGLLGTIKSFQNKYSTPIESQQAPDKLLALRSLVSPYILRRIKSEVLTELPPKTEQTIHVEQSAEELVFYEALRRNAEERMAHFMEENNRIAVLAEITKLRQACCDSSLVDSAISLNNSKLNAFIETVKNIIDNGHKALVFSQYVSFLAIVKKRIEAEKISYQYIDGSTSPAQRKRSVNAFQAGEGDLFLLSLKAGGSGLNLTAADYVIHLDPWWNPAVEDQASDRAHRIGQERPVTIYRFIMQNTIEEKIISLHEHKRNLANELLSGQGVSGKLSNEDLMSLITTRI